MPVVSRCRCVSKSAQPRDFSDKKREKTTNASSNTIATPWLQCILFLDFSFILLFYPPLSYRNTDKVFFFSLFLSLLFPLLVFITSRVDTCRSYVSPDTTNLTLNSNSFSFLTTIAHTLDSVLFVKGLCLRTLSPHFQNPSLHCADKKINSL